MKSVINIFGPGPGARKIQEKREIILKKKILHFLNEQVQELEYLIEIKGHDNASSNCDYTELCCAIEAIFLHGLKHSLLSITVDFLSNDIDRRPEPSFWAILMIISHRNIIKSIQQRSQLTSDIAYCRAFIRQTLNENTLSSYMTNMLTNPSSVRSYYYKHAFLRDKEMLQLVIKIIESIESKANFQLNINSSLLNQWPNLSLELAGIWSLARKSAQVDSADDVASSLPKENYLETYNRLLSTHGMVRAESGSQTSGRSTPSLSVNEDPIEAVSFDEEMFTRRKNFSLFRPLEDDQKTINSMTDSQILIEDRTSETLSPQVSPDEESPNLDSPNLDIEQTEQSRRDTNLDNFNLCALVKRYQESGLEKETKKEQPGIMEIVRNFQSTVDKLKEESEQSQDEDWHKLDADSIFQGQKSKLVDLAPLVEQLCKLANESGFDGQDYKCKKCSLPINIDFQGFQICYFSGFYYCDTCMSSETFIIPARAIFNWDFKRYHINVEAANFFKEFQYEPFIDIHLLNSDYTEIRMMHRLKNLRIKLNAISSYMVNCESACNTFKEKLCYREYFFTTIHKYSITDLELLPHGQLEQLLTEAVNFGISHIMECTLCSQQGFICEICSDPQIIYPFDIDNTVKCDVCHSLFHKICYAYPQPCPKCDRRKKREAAPVEF